MTEPTVREFRVKHAQLLDEQFAQSYPQGKFSLQIREQGKYEDIYTNPQAYRCLAWEPRRSTSRARPHGVVCYQLREGSVHEDRYKNNSFGFNKAFTSLAKLVACAQAKGFSDELILTFTQHFA